MKNAPFLDINECAKGTHTCSADAVCNNTNGSYNCTCNPGYYGDGWVCQGKFILNKSGEYLTVRNTFQVAN